MPLVGLAGTQPLLLVIDDLHRADGETLAILLTVCAALAGHPAMVALARRGTEGEGHGLKPATRPRHPPLAGA